MRGPGERQAAPLRRVDFRRGRGGRVHSGHVPGARRSTIVIIHQKRRYGAGGEANRPLGQHGRLLGADRICARFQVRHVRLLGRIFQLIQGGAGGIVHEQVVVDHVAQRGGALAHGNRHAVVGADYAPSSCTAGITYVVVCEFSRKPCQRSLCSMSGKIASTQLK